MVLGHSKTLNVLKQWQWRFKFDRLIINTNTIIRLILITYVMSLSSQKVAERIVQVSIWMHLVFSGFWLKYFFYINMFNTRSHKSVHHISIYNNRDNPHPLNPLLHQSQPLNPLLHQSQPLNPLLQPIPPTESITPSITPTESITPSITTTGNVLSWLRPSLSPSRAILQPLHRV